MLYCEYLFNNSAKNLFPKTLSEVVEDSLRIIHKVACQLFERCPQIFDPKGSNNQCHLHSLFIVDYANRFPTYSDNKKMAKTEENRFMLLCFLRSFYFIRKRKPLIQVICKIEKLKLKKRFQEFIKDGNEFLRKASRNALIESFQNILTSRLQANQNTDPLMKELLALAEEKPRYLSKDGKDQVFTYPKFPGVCLFLRELTRISHKISGEDGGDVASDSFTMGREHCPSDKARPDGGKDGVTDRSALPRRCEEYGLNVPCMIHFLIITKNGCGHISVGPQDAKIAIEGILTDESYSLKRYMEDRKFCPKNFSFEGNSSAGHICRLCGDKIENLKPYEDKIRSVFQNFKKTMKAFGASFIKIEQMECIPILEKYSEINKSFKKHLRFLNELEGINILHIHPGAKYKIETSPEKFLEMEGLL